MKYKGFTYSQEKDYEPDNIKIFHTVVTPEGKEVSMDWSSYSTPSQSDFELWVEIGLPDRMHPALGERRVLCPLDTKDLVKIRMDILSLSTID